MAELQAGDIVPGGFGDPITLMPVKSSCVAAVGYDPTGRTMVVVFHSSGVYTYFMIPPEIYADFMAAPSMGAYVNKMFKQGGWMYQKGLIAKALTMAPLE